MDISELKDEYVENATISFKVTTLKRIKKFMKINKIKKFSPTIDKIVNDFLDSQEFELDVENTTKTQGGSIMVPMKQKEEYK
tara:strand:- start:11018 stop:11263 length:246 start_codon:yes stop_codon:yes gene_type:complete